jgi:hypothetical protein
VRGHTRPHAHVRSCTRAAATLQPAPATGDARSFRVIRGDRSACAAQVSGARVSDAVGLASCGGGNTNAAGCARLQLSAVRLPVRPLRHIYRVAAQPKGRFIVVCTDLRGMCTYISTAQECILPVSAGRAGAAGRQGPEHDPRPVGQAGGGGGRGGRAACQGLMRRGAARCRQGAAQGRGRRPDAARRAGAPRQQQGTRTYACCGVLAA